VASDQKVPVIADCVAVTAAVAKRLPHHFYQDPFTGRWLTRASYSLEAIVVAVMETLIDGEADA
jgi:hypothetical protein